MKKISWFAVAIIALLSSCQTGAGSNKESEAEVDPTEKKIEALLSKMSLEEKAGQMTQVTLDFVAEGKPYDASKEIKVDLAKARSAIVDNHVGSILNTGMYAISRDKWYEVITAIQKIATEETKNKIPIIYGIDAIHGANYTQNSTLFPQELATAATWEPEFARQCGEVTAYEVRASGITWNFSPVLDLARNPLWSRFFETFGEDPYLVSEMGKAIVQGYQGDDMSDKVKVLACLKHFLGYSNSKTGKDRTPIQMSEREMREYYLVPFQEAIDAGAMSVMVNSTEINGTPVHADKHILTDILKDELGFRGFAVTDWEDIIMLHSVHNVASSYKEAVKIAINAGIDMSMVPLDVDFTKYLIELVNEGEVSMDRVDDAVRRILRAKMKLGLFEKPYYPKEEYDQFNAQESQDKSYKAALEAITLLKNENQTLPLSKEMKVLITGVGADRMEALNGAWSRTWQGVDMRWETEGKLTVKSALENELGKANVVWVEGTNWDEDINTAEAVQKAKSVDAIIVCLGEVPATEKVGDIEDLAFPKAQLELAKKVAASGKPVIAVLMSSRPRLFTEVEPLFSAVVDAYWLGEEGGRALAKTLIGENNPSGKLPFTYPRSSGSLLTYDYKLSETRDKNFGNNAVNPLYPFGHGLSYTSFEYSDLKISAETMEGDNELTVSVNVKNVGDVSGKEVVQLYSRDHYASITPSQRRLRRFDKIELEPGESKEVEFKISAKDLAFVNKELQWVTEPGKFDLMIDELKVTFEYK